MDITDKVLDFTAKVGSAIDGFVTCPKFLRPEKNGKDKKWKKVCRYALPVAKVACFVAAPLPTIAVLVGSAGAGLAAKEARKIQKMRRELHSTKKATKPRNLGMATAAITGVANISPEVLKELSNHTQKRAEALGERKSSLTPTQETTKASTEKSEKSSVGPVKIDPNTYYAARKVYDAMNQKS